MIQGSHQNLSLLLEPAADQALRLGAQAMLLKGFALPVADALLTTIADVQRVSPPRHMVTRGGWKMSVAMTNCGNAGWITDRSGYRYDAVDPETGNLWPPMPALFRELATQAAVAAGFAGFIPDACLINQYRPGARLSLHQDLNERDFSAPIVSVSLGLPATFLWGGRTRPARVSRVPLCHGDVAVWGGVDRLNFHGIAPLKAGMHALTGALRYNLTFRRAS